MRYLLPLLVVIPLGAAFLIPLVSLLAAKRKWPCGEVVALLATGALVVISLATFGYPGTWATWIGGYRGQSDLLGVDGRVVSGVGPAEEARGLLVGDVAANSRAARSGLREGDLVLAFARGADGRFQAVQSLNHLRRENASLPLNGELVLRVVRDGQSMHLTISGGKSTVGIAMVCDGMCRLMLIVISVVSFSAMLFSLSYMRAYTKLHLYYSPIMLMVAGMNAIVISGDLFNIYVFLEVAAVASYALVGFGV
ncbi:MAG: hypothetical protein PVJ27_03445, partial [Candidatus Brocadiaceae bacterium]